MSFDLSFSIHSPASPRCAPGLAGVLALALALLAGCGGGGGGGGGGANPPAPAPVIVGAPGVTAVNATVLQGQAVPDVVLTGALSGDVEGLDGRPVYVQVLDPGALFQQAALLAVERVASGWRYRLDLRGQALASLGRRTGSLQVSACLDAACAQPLAGTPVRLPYDVNVVAGLGLGSNVVEVSVPFGTVPAVQTVAVALSGLSNGFVARNTTPYDPNRMQTAIVAATGPFNAAGNLLSVAENGVQQASGPLAITLLPAPPGTYEETITVSSLVVQGPGTGSTLVERNIAVRYTVTPNPDLDHVFYPPRVDIVRSASDTAVAFRGYLLVPGAGLQAVLEGVDLLDKPAGAGTGPVDSWLQNFSALSAVTCSGRIDPASGSTLYSCLAPGLYTAQVRWRLQGPSGSRVVTLPVTMTVTP